jgi:hypothetical protein
MSSTVNVQFSGSKMKAFKRDDYRHVLNCGFVTTGWTASAKTLPWNGYNFALYQNADASKFALAVIQATAPSASSREYNLYGTRYAVGQKATDYLLAVHETANGGVAANKVTFRGMPLATTADGTLLLVAVTPTTDANATMFVGGSPVQIKRSGGKWYIVTASL